MLNRWIKKYWWLFVSGFILIIALSFLITLTRANPFSKTILLFFNDWSIVLSAMTTVILAVVAFWSIIESRRIREEDKLRDISRFTLDKVYLWVRQLSELSFRMENPMNLRATYSLLTEVTSLRFQLFEIRPYSDIFKEHFGDVFDNTEKALNEYAKAISDKQDEIKNLQITEQEKAFIDLSLSEYWVRLPRSINICSNRLLNIISNLRIQLKL